VAVVVQGDLEATGAEVVLEEAAPSTRVPAPVRVAQAVQAAIVTVALPATAAPAGTVPMLRRAVVTRVVTVALGVPAATRVWPASMATAVTAALVERVTLAMPVGQAASEAQQAPVPGWLETPESTESTECRA
jgi:hypothetical protein